MKDRGYITKDFPFLEESIVRELQTILEKTENYWDFGELIASRVIDSNTHPTLVYLTLYHLSRLRNMKALHQIMDAHPELPIPFPFYSPSGNDYYHDKPIIDKVIEINRNPVITFYMLMRLFRTSPFGSPEEEQTIDLIEKFLAEHPELKHHSADYIGHAGYRRKLTGQPEESYDLMREALTLARESGDKWHQASLLTLLGEVVGQYRKGMSTFSNAKEHLSEAVALCREINDKAGLANTLQTMCVFAYSRGELGEAYDCQLESILMQGEIGEISVNAASNMAGLYRRNGEIESALEMEQIVQAAEDKVGPYAYFQVAGRLLSQGNLKEAEIVLDRARELTMSLGLETALGNLYGLEAKLLRVKGDLESAMESLQKNLDIQERASRQLRVRVCLIELVDMELEMYAPTKENRDDEYSGPWMERFAKEVESNDIPGFYSRYLLLQSELRMRQGRHVEAEEILDTVLEFTDSNATRFLHRDALAIKEKWVEEGVIPLDAPRRPRDR